MKKKYKNPKIRIEEIGTSYGLMTEGSIESGGTTEDKDIIEAYSKKQGFWDEDMSVWDEEEDIKK